MKIKWVNEEIAWNWPRLQTTSFSLTVQEKPFLVLASKDASKDAKIPVMPGPTEAPETQRRYASTLGL